MARAPLTVQRTAVTRLWLHLQGYSTPRASVALTRDTFVQLLERVGGLQLDSVNALDRAHYLSLWSRFGTYKKSTVDRWVYDKRLGYEYWGHEASVLPMSHLPLGLRRMRRFPPQHWRRAAWWARWNTSPASKRRVMALLRTRGPMERADIPSGPQRKEDQQSLLVLWHSGRAAISRRRHFRRVYDLAERVYPPVEAASSIDLENSWLMTGLRGNGIACEEHLVNYWTAPRPKAELRRRILDRCLKQRRIVKVQVRGFRQAFYALPQHLAQLDTVPAPHGTTLICPFDSLLWQRRRAEDLLNFRYRIEIYVPRAKRTFGYYVCPILHNGRLAGRVDPKLHRQSGLLEVKHIFFEPDFKADHTFRTGFRDALESLATFLGATDIRVPGTVQIRA